MTRPDRPTVLVTGTSSGFGKGMVEEFFERGWHVFATMLRAGERTEIYSDLAARSRGRLTLLELDVTSPEDRAAALQAVEDHGRLDCLINNAGYGNFGALADLGEEQLRRQFEVNFFGAALLTKQFTPLLMESRGTLLFVSSAFGFNGFPLTASYCASKFAVEGFAESLYYELAPHGVHVGVLEPGANATGFGVAVEWGEGNTPEFRKQTAGYRAMKKRIGSTAPDNSRVIGSIAADMAEGLDRRNRAIVGRDAWAGYLFRMLVPDFVALPLQRLLYGRVLGP